MNLNRLLYLPITLLLALITFGCATGEKFTAPKTARSGTALVYVFRPSCPPFANKPKILVNGTQTANLNNKGYFNLELQPGTYTVKADWSWNSGVPDSEVTFKAESGQTYYVEVDSSMHNTGFVASPSTVVPKFRFKGGMALVSADTATAKMSQCGVVKKIPGVESLILPQ